MTKMRKLLSVILCLVLVLSLCAACGEKPVETKSPTPAGDPDWVAMGTPMADARIRQALRYAIDMDTIIETMFNNKATKATSLTAPGMWRPDDLEGYDYNPDEAKKLLAEAGWPADYTLDVVYYYADQQTVDMMSVIQGYWKQVGVKAEFRKLEGDLNAQLWARPADIEKGPSAVEWDIAYAGIGALVEDEFYGRFASTGSSNSYLPKDTELDKLYQATKVLDTEAQVKAYHELQKYMNDKYIAGPLYHILAYITTSDKLDMVGNGVGNDQYAYQKNILDWKINRDNGIMYTNGGPVELFEIPTINPALYPYQEYVFDRLLFADQDLTPTTGNLAESYKVSDDGKSIEFVLRDGIKWHDGAAFSGEDVKFTIDLYKELPTMNPVAQGVFTSVSDVVIDGLKVTVNFAKVAPDALSVFTQWPILPQHLLKDANPLTFQQDKYWQKPIGTGPYKIEKVALGNDTILARYDDYHFTGTGNIEKIVMHASAESDANLIKNAEAGLIDYAFTKSTDDVNALAKLSNMTVHDANMRFTRLFYFNMYPHEAKIK